MKTAIVTGGTSGIGLGVAKMLLSKGYKVFATYVGTDFTETIENFEPVKVNQCCREELYSFITRVKEECKTIDCIVCNFQVSILVVRRQRRVVPASPSP